MVDITLEGRRALITGGSRGLGRAMAAAFAAAGAEVMIAARDAEALEEARAAIAAKSGATVLMQPCDVRQATDIARLFASAEKDLGGVDILANNAGGSSRGPFEEVADEMWQADLDLKLFAAIRLSRLVLPGMRERRWGRILNTVSTAGKAPGPASAPTSVSRAAGIALSKVLAHEYAAHNITVNALCSGWIMSAQWPRFHQQEAPDVDFDTFIAGRAKGVPAGRLGDAHEFAGLACFLASDAGAYITGTAINVDGGKSPVV